MASAKVTALLSLILMAAACGGANPTAVSAPTGEAEITISNHGAAMEGHTPTGFAGSGTGLFVGDNLNSSFPEGQGVQTYLTFAIPNAPAIDRAVLTSDALHTTGAPFEDLGDLLAERVEYDTFGRELFDLGAASTAVRCNVTNDTTIECDVTAAVQGAISQGLDSTQFRLRFEEVADNDGQADLALFYRTDSNTNERGLFTLRITTQ